ncbi:MAG: sensor histidine kinase [Thermoguttaceae bacterium]
MLNRNSHKLHRAAFRILRESLANACRHSQNKRLVVELTLDGNVLRVQVRDGGVGFDPNGTPPGHFGLNGIRRRLKLLGGRATVNSQVG